MKNIKLMQVSSLEKIFLKEAPKCEEYTKATVLKGEEFSYQIIYFAEGRAFQAWHAKIDTEVIIESPLKEFITVKKVGNVPSELPAYDDSNDEHYITTEPGLFPDILYPIEGNEVEVIVNSYHSLWISVNINENIKAGKYPIKIAFTNHDLSICESKEMELDIIDAVLPKQKLIYTQWFHTDCIASYYNVEMFSEKHWELIEKFLKMAVDNGINMILTPVFTPPLDTKVNGERPTVQLVDIYKDGDNYSFNFDKLIKWIKLCKKNGIEYFEISHLFTQWGAEYTPKIIAMENGELKRIFGWDVESTSEKYKTFLNAFLPKLIEVLKENSIEKQTYFHISDEPEEKHLQSYMTAKSMVKELLKDFKIIDALSSYEFYDKGIVENPIPASNHIEPFLENNVPELWTYYCCGQNIGVSNRFMSMPSYRNRIIATQFYKYNIAGFLQWGYNFYYSLLSKYKINPFLVTDAINAIPSGDAFSVYPYDNGPIESIRLKVFKEALQDLRAMELLEEFLPKSEVVELIEKDLEVPITFDKYPNSAKYILLMRESINRKIAGFIR